MDKKALIHVENTTDLIEFAMFLSDSDWTIFSANATEDFLKNENICVTRESILHEANFFINDTSQLVSRIINTKLPQNGRLNPGEESYYVLCLNINPKIRVRKANEKIIPTSFQISALIRNAIINYENVLILTDPADYKEAMIQLRTDSIDPAFRVYLAGKALNMVSAFDAALSNSITPFANTNGEFLNYLSYPFTKFMDFEKSSNEHQKGCLFLIPSKNRNIPYNGELSGKQISYNVAADISFAWEQISFLYKHLKNQFAVNCVNCEGYNFTNHFTPLTGIVFTIVVKYNSIVGAALSSNAQESFLNAYKFEDSLTDLTLGCSSVIDEAAAKEIVKGNFIAVIAPGFTEEAKQILYQNANIHLIPGEKTNIKPYALKMIDGGILFQHNDVIPFKQWDVKTANRPSQYIADEMAFGSLLSISAKSHSAILLKNSAITGIGQGCLSAEKAVIQALNEAKSTMERNKISGTLADLLISDTPLSLCDSVKELIENGLSAIIQTGGTAQDDEFIKYCNDHGIVMIFTNMTHINF